MTKVEQVARAIDACIVLSKKTFAAKCGQITAILDAIPFEKQSDAYREECRMLARVAIKAMREPTNAMIGAATIGSFGTPEEWAEANRALWYTMIDAALKETE